MEDLDRAALMDSFRSEAEEGLASMEESLLALEQRPGDTEALARIVRTLHTIKGNSACMGLSTLPQFTHAIEDALAQAKDPIRLITPLLECVDVLRAMTRDAGTEREVAAHGGPEVLARLRLASEASPTALPESAPLPDDGRRREAGGARTLRVDIETLDRLLNLTGEIAIARGRLTRALEERGGAQGTQQNDLLEEHREADRLYLDLQEQVMKARMVRVGPLLRSLVRMVRDVAQAHGKQARLKIEGEDVEVDTKIIQSLRDPLTHMIRNAIDHGIERPEARAQAGKDPCGTLVLSAQHEGSNIVVRMTDDGAGFNRARILERARALGLLSETESPIDDDVFRLVFRSGFSTAETVTDLSGRGVGMDVVLREIEGLRGSVYVESHLGLGSAITIRLPLTLSIIDGFEVGAAGESYIIPMDAVVECLEMPEEHAGREGSGIVNLRGRVLPFARLRHLFAMDGAATTRRENVVVLQHSSGQVGLAVDALLGERQAVVKPLGRTFQGLKGVSGSTILGDGRVALILDVPTLVQMALAISDVASGARVA